MTMRIAYLIAAHKNPDQLRQLLSVIYRPQNQYVIHIDSRAPEEMHAAARCLKSSYTNVAILPAVPCIWGLFNQVRVTLNSIRTLLDSDWDYFLNLSGQDLPLVTQEEICSFLDNRAGKNFVEVIDQRKDWPASMGRVTGFYVNVTSVRLNLLEIAEGPWNQSNRRGREFFDLNVKRPGLVVFA
jgi:Core-2/I-Branching enzyme